MPFTNYADQQLMLLLFSDTSYAIPANWYVGLSTTTPTQAKGSAPFWNFTEPSGSGYARVSTPNDGSHLGGVAIANGYEVENLTVISFPLASGSWGTLTYFGIWDALTAGNLIAYGSLGGGVAVTSPDVAQFAINALTVTND